jgi:hypothetical protein
MSMVFTNCNRRGRSPEISVQSTSGGSDATDCHKEFRPEFVASHPGNFTCWTGSLYSLSRKVGSPQRRFGCFWEHKISCTYRDSNPGRYILSVVSVPNNKDLRNLGSSEKKFLNGNINENNTAWGHRTGGWDQNVCTVFTVNVKRCLGIRERR